MALMSTRAERAERRRSEWTGAVVPSGTPKGCHYADLPVDERLIAFAILNDSVWRSAGRLPLPDLARDEWPGCIVDLMARE